MSLAEIIQQYRTKLLTYEAQAEASIRSAHSHMLATVKPHLDTLYGQMKAAKSGDEPVPLHWLYTGDKLGNVKHLVSSQVNHFGGQAKVQVIDLQHKAALFGVSSAREQLAMPVHVYKSPSASAMNNLVGTSRSGKSLDELVGGFGEEAADKVGKALISGVSLGKDPDWIDNLIMAALLISLSRALTISRTEEMNAYRDGWTLTAQQNNAQQWQWIAFPGACPFCESMDGTLHDISEDMESHPNCRCQQKLVVV